MRDQKIPWDLEGTPLQIMTDSTLGSDELIDVRMYDKDSSYIGFVAVKFSSPMQYFIGGNCITEWTDLSVQPPVEVNKIWTIAKTETAWIITCNGVEVLNFRFADSSAGTCVSNWGGDVVEEIKFHNNDKASDSYSAGKFVIIVMP